MKIDLLIKNGVIVNAEGRMTADLAVNGSVIAAIGRPGSFSGAQRVIDATGKYVLPGAIDTHTHIEEVFQGVTPDETWAAASSNAAVGGITTVINFAIQEKGRPLMEVVREQINRAQSVGSIDFNLHGTFTDYSDINAVLKEIDELFGMGVTSLKAFMIFSSDDLFADDWALFNLMRRVKKHGGFLGVHAENMSIGERLQDELIAAGKTKAEYWPLAKPNFIEAEAVQRACILAQATQSNLYIVHTSAGESVDIVRSYRQKGTRVFCETCPHYLIFDETIHSREGIGVWEIISPPLRKKADQDALWAGINDGTVTILGSDHNPLGKAGKERGYKEGGFAGVANGGPGLLEGLVAAHHFGVGTGRITMERLVEVTSTNAAKMFGMYPRKGTLRPGSDADIVIFDSQKTQTLGSHLYKGMDFTVYEGVEVKGFPTITILRGEVLVEDGKFVGKEGYGRFVPGNLNEDTIRNIR